ncbi:MAG: PAS domain-containing protein, partial [Clostridia bacterium]|nr:PAS domain-containing protein [Clostridia bacterium]
MIPDDLKVFEQAISDTLKADGPVDVEFRTATGKGSVRWLQVRSNLY